MEDQRIHEKIDREIKATKELAAHELKMVERDIKESIRSFQRQRARDKSDYDLKLQQQVDKIREHTEKLEEHALNFEALAIVNSMLIENISMQMEGEIADLLDRRMMSLFGVTHDKLDKVDVQNTSQKLKQVKEKRGGKSVGDSSGFLPNTQASESVITSAKMAKSPTNFTIGINQTQANNQSMFTNVADSLEEIPTNLGSIDEKDRGSGTLLNDIDATKQILQKTGNLPITIDKSCLICMQSGRDTQMVMKLFKTACLSYQATDVNYREHRLSRN